LASKEEIKGFQRKGKGADGHSYLIEKKKDKMQNTLKDQEMDEPKVTEVEEGHQIMGRGQGNAIMLDRMALLGEQEDRGITRERPRAALLSERVEKRNHRPNESGFGVGGTETGVRTLAWSQDGEKACTKEIDRRSILGWLWHGIQVKLREGRGRQREQPISHLG